MPSGYSLYDMTLFPFKGPGETIAVPFQIPLIEGVEAPRTEFKLTRQLDNGRIDVFRVLHEVLERRIGRAKGVEFTEFVASYHFPSYYHRPSKMCMVKVKKEVARSAMKILIDKVSEVEGSYRRINLQSIQSYIERFKGVWFRVSGSADVSSQALFGPSVDRDIRFEQALRDGQIFNIRMDYPFANEYFHIGISDDYSLVVFDDHMDELLELELVLDIKTNLLDLAKPRE